MAKVILDADIEAISGKLSKTKSAMYVYNARTGKCYRAEYNRDRKESNTELQQAVKATFTSKAKVAAAWWAANKPASDSATPTAEWTAMMKLYDGQHKYGNRYSFVRARVKDDLTLAFTSAGTTPSVNPDDDSFEM